MEITICLVNGQALFETLFIRDLSPDKTPAGGGILRRAFCDG
jgi:hypothetical protein